MRGYSIHPVFLGKRKLKGFVETFYGTLRGFVGKFYG
jgi:hypothetical protein